MNNMNQQQGFTLIELLIATVLGLLITAAAAQMFITSYKTSAAQQAVSGVVDANVFGLQQVERSVRLAGYGIISDDVTGTGKDNNSGILLNLAGSPSLSGLTTAGLTKSDGTSVQTSSGTASQLTVQYRAPTDMRDCEGQLALGYREVTTKTSISEEENGGEFSNTASGYADGQVVVERYYLRANSNGGFDLYCDAGRYLREEITTDKSEHPQANDENAKLTSSAYFNYVDKGTADGTLVIANVDDFQIQLGTKNGDSIQYYTPAAYGTSSTEIVAVKLSILVRGENAFNAADADGPQNPTYTMLGNNVTMTASDKFLRRVYETNISLRNAAGNRSS